MKKPLAGEGQIDANKTRGGAGTRQRARQPDPKLEEQLKRNSAPLEREINRRTREFEQKHAPLSDEADFLFSWLQQTEADIDATEPGEVLAREIAEFAYNRRSESVVEFGAGSGIVAKALIDAGILPSRLILVEPNPVLCQYLRTDFPEALVLECDTYSMRLLIEALLLSPAAAIISNLPFVSKPMTARLRFIRDVMDLMRPQARFILRTYSNEKPLPRLEGISMEVLSVTPPVSVWVYRKTEFEREVFRHLFDETSTNETHKQYTQNESLDSGGILQQQKLQIPGRVVGGTETPAIEEVNDAKKQISNDQILELLSERGVNAQLCQQVAADLVMGSQKRPQWIDRAKYKDLAYLSAPRFLKAVYADFLDDRGNLKNEEAVRLSDPTLVQIVQGFINKRRERSLPLGDAEGIAFKNREGRGRPKKAKRRRASGSPRFG